MYNKENFKIFLFLMFLLTLFLYAEPPQQINFKRFFSTKSWPIVSTGFEDGSVSVETAIFYNSPPSIKIDCSRTKLKIVSITFYLTKDSFQPFKGKTVTFNAKIKRIAGSEKPYIQVRFNHIDETGKYQYLFGKNKPIDISGSEWTDVSFTVEIPHQENVNAANFQIYTNNNSVEPPVFIIDECILIEETGKTPEEKTKKASSSLLFLSKEGEQPLEIVKNGKPVAVIVTSSKPTNIVKYAVQELNEHIRLSTGTTLPVATDEENINNPSIHIGLTRISKQLGISPDILPPDTWVIKKTGNRLIISGGDSKNDINPVGKDLVPLGTLFATYEFLERIVGVRWFWPGDDGRFVPEHKDIIVNSIDLQGYPSYETRFVFYGIPEGITSDEAWKWWRRMRLGGKDGNPIGMHSFTKWNEKYGKQHPEWFALQINGERLNEPQQDINKNGHLCYTNPEVIKAVIEEARNTFDKNPSLKYFAVMPGDSNSRYYCQCKNCQALIKPDETEDKKYSFAIWSFVNKVAEEIRKTHPDRFITCCAYNGYRIPPDNVYFQPNVVVTFCVPSELRNPWNPEFKKNYVDEINAWNKRVQNLYVWDYWLYRWQPGLYGAPAIYPHLLSEIYLLENTRIKGRVIELCNKDSSGALTKFWQDWMMDQINVYVGFKLLWNSNQNVDEILKEYYKFFGPAESLIEKFYESMEKAFLDPQTKGKENIWDWDTCWNKTYTPEFVNRVMDYLKEAERITREKEPYHTRVEKLLKGFSTFENTSKKYSSVEKTATKEKNIFIPQAKTVPVIDGKLDEPCWKEAVIADNFVDLYNSPVETQTKFLLMNDGNNFYIGITAYIDNKKIKQYPNPGTKDATLWDYESCEMFFSPDAVQCYQFLIGPGNVFTDMYIPEIENFKIDSIRWNARDIEYATTISEKEWTAEIKIPFSSIKFNPESKYRVNFCRNFYLFDEKQNSWIHLASSWQPVFGSFHNLSKYGFLEISKIIK